MRQTRNPVLVGLVGMPINRVGTGGSTSTKFEEVVHRERRARNHGRLCNAWLGIR